MRHRTHHLGALALTIAVLTSLSLNGCGLAGTSSNVNNRAQTSVFQLKSGWQLPKAAAATYVGLPRCPQATAICADQKAVDQIRLANKAGDDAIDAAEKTVRTTADQDTAQAAINAAQSAIAAAEKILTDYGITWSS
jgi:hypothetical protein